MFQKRIKGVVLGFSYSQKLSVYSPSFSNETIEHFIRTALFYLQAVDWRRLLVFIAFSLSFFLDTAPA